MATEFAKIIHAMVVDSAVPVKELARRIGKPYSTLLREANPYDERAKLGVETFVQLIKATGDISPMEHIARELDLELVPKKRPAAK